MSLKAAAGAACAALFIALPGIVDGHGYLVEPPARQVVDGSSTGNCPHCGNGGSKGAPGSVCGDGNQWPTSSYYVQAVQEPHRTYTAGSIVQFEISMNVNHMGHHEFFICDQPISSNTGAVECLQKWPLHRVAPEEVHNDCVPNDSREDCQPIDPKFPGRWYHPPGMSMHRIRYRIPSDLTCSHCTLQWFWPTANSRAYDEVGYSCYLRRLESLGWSRFNFCGWACSDSKCPDFNAFTPDMSGPRAPDPSVGPGFEEFRNCADIRVVGGSGSSSSAPSTSTAVTTVAPTSTQGPTSSMPPTTAGPTGEECVPIADCSGMSWCDFQAYRAWCLSQGAAGTCPAPECMLKTLPSSSSSMAPEMTSSTMAPTTTTTSSQAPASTTTSAGAPSGKTCVATPGLNRGVSDSDCTKCADGYAWWPCNEAGLCDCSGMSLAQAGAQLRKKRKASLASVKRHDKKGHVLMQAGTDLSVQDGLGFFEEL